jgi:hypothetical protein
MNAMKKNSIEDSNCVDDTLDIIFERIVWMMGWIEGFIIGCIIGRETHHGKHRPKHELGSELIHGFERGCSEGTWFGEHS